MTRIRYRAVIQFDWVDDGADHGQTPTQVRTEWASNPALVIAEAVDAWLEPTPADEFNVISTAVEWL